MSPFRALTARAFDYASHDSPCSHRNWRATSTNLRYELLRSDRCEKIEDYVTGGLHPVHLGDVLANKYRVVHKLGWGGFSTVWLTRNLMDSSIKAVKILTAEASRNDRELEIMRQLRRRPLEVSECPGIVSLLDQFKIAGPNGIHHCTVTDVAGPTIAHLSDSSGGPLSTRRLKGNLAQKSAKEVAEAVRFLHDSGLGHGGKSCRRVSGGSPLISRIRHHAS